MIKTSRRILICSLMLCGFLHAETMFKFMDYKVNGSLGLSFLQQLRAAFQAKTFIETGTFGGGTTENAAKIFQSVHTVELHENMYINSAKMLSQYKNVKTYHGNSTEVFKKILPPINDTVIFWLDAHCSGDGTALTFNDPNHPEAVTPIRAELAAIANHKNECADYVILIDDIRDFGIIINDQTFWGSWAYPTIQEVHRLLMKINQDFDVVLLGDTLLAYDKTKHTPSFSPVAIACSKTRLYDGSNLSDQELMVAERIIMDASDSEKMRIKSLYKMMSDRAEIGNCKEPMFLHDLWYGLVCFGEKSYDEALSAFSKVPVRTMHFDTRRNIVDTTIRYDHWRIDSYIQKAMAGVKNMAR